MKVSKKMFEISEQMKGLRTEAEVLNSNGETEKAVAKMNEYDELKKSFDAEKRIYESAKDFDLYEKNDGVDGTTAEKKPNAVKSFADAARRKFLVEGTNADGGYTVPEDIQTQINHYKSNVFSLEDYITIQSVSTNSGARTFLTRADDFALSEVAENGVISEIDTPTFERISYKISDYGGFLPVSKDLLADTDANITAEISSWFAKAARGTTNKEILALIAKKTQTEFKSLDDINKSVVVTLGGAYKGSVAIYTNDDGILYLTTLKDGNGRYLLNPNPSDPAKMQIAVGATVIPVVQIPNSVLATTESKVPFIVGDFKSAFVKFDRQKSLISTSDVASTTKYNAFTQNLILYKIFMRMDYQTIDSNAFVNGYISVSTSKSTDSGKASQG
jgi:HK97 family phage major capsid protein